MKRLKSTEKMLMGIVLVLSVFSAASCSFLPEEEEDLVLPIVSEAETSYRTFEVKRDDIESSVNTYGMVLSKENYQQKFMVPGTIATVNVSQGQSVRAGDVIATLQNSELDKKISQKQEEVAQVELLYKEDPTTLNEEIVNIKKRELYELEERYKQYRIYSSSSGTVTFVTAKAQGDEVGIDEIIAVVSGTRDFILEVGTSMYDKVDTGMSVECTYDGGTYTGTVIFSSKNKDQNPESFGMVESFKGVAVKMNSVPKGIEAGDLVQVDISLASKKDVLVVPTSAVYEFDGVQLVYIWKDGIRIERKVELGIKSVTFYEVLSGLSEGEIVTY